MLPQEKKEVIGVLDAAKEVIESYDEGPEYILCSNTDCEHNKSGKCGRSYVSVKTCECVTDDELD